MPSARIARRRLFGVGLAAFLSAGVLPGAAAAACADGDLERYRRMGLTEAEIGRLCGAATDLSVLTGFWMATLIEERTNVPTPMRFGPVLTYWRIEAQGDRLAFAEVQDYDLGCHYARIEPMRVHGLAVQDGTVTISATSGQQRAYSIRLPLDGGASLSGSYESEDDSFPLLGPTRSAGRVELRRAPDLDC